MITQNASAEFGNYQGGIINATIKSGTNAYHGDAFESFRNDKLNAAPWEQNWTPGSESRPCAGISSATSSADRSKGQALLLRRLPGIFYDIPTSINQVNLYTSAERDGRLFRPWPRT